MKLFKLDLMTLLVIVVFIGVVVTMSTQANDHAVMGGGAEKASVSVVGKA